MGRYTFYECDNLLLQMLDTDFIRRSLKDSKCLKHFSHYNVNCMFKKKNYKSSVCRSSAGCQEFLKSSYGRQIYNTINRQPGLKMYNINIHQPTSSYDIMCQSITYETIIMPRIRIRSPRGIPSLC